MRHMKIEVSTDGKQWRAVFEKNDLTAVPGFDPRWIVEIQTEPVDEGSSGYGDPPGCALDEFEILAPAAVPAKQLPAIVIHDLTGRREIALEKRYLNLPIKNHAPHRRMTISVDGREIHVLDIELAAEKPDLWAFLDVAAYKGKKATIVVDAVPEGSRGLQSIDQSDELKNADTLYKERLRPQFHYTQKIRLEQRPQRPGLLRWRMAPLLPAPSGRLGLGRIYALGTRRQQGPAALAGTARGPLPACHGQGHVLVRQLRCGLAEHLRPSDRQGEGHGSPFR